MKKLLCLVLALVMVLAIFASCQSSKAPEEAAPADKAAVAEEKAPAEEAASAEEVEEQLHFVYVTPLVAHPVWLVAKEGFDDACAEFGIRGDWVGPTVIDANEMIKLIETAIVEKADGIITQGMNPEAMVPVLNKCEEAGIPLIVVNSDIPDGPRLAYLGTEPINFGNTGAKYALDLLDGEPVNAAYMMAALDYSIGHEFIEGYEQVFNEAPNGYQQLTIAADNADLMTAVQQWENIFTTYPECNVAICLCATSAAGAAKVIEEKGLEGIIVMGIDDIEETLDYVDQGLVQATLAQNFYRMGYQPVQWIKDYIETGVAPEELLNDSGSIIVDKSNLDTYDENMKVPSSW